MADETENLTIRLLQEMRKEIGARFDGVDSRLDELSVAVAVLSADLKTIKEDSGDLRRGQKIIETELRALRGRVERIEDKLDPVKV